MAQKTRNQELAEKVYEQVIKWKDNSETNTKAYGGMCHKLPILIRSAGLAQALAFVDTRNKDKTPQKEVLVDLARVLGKEKDTFLNEVRTMPLSEYIYVTRQSLLALNWFKRFAVSILHVEANSNTDGEGEQSDGK